MLNGEVIEAVFDSGASVSVISAKLARRLNLSPNGDKLPLAALDDKSGKLYDVTVDVPIRVPGKLRPEHMCICTDTDRDFLLLRMTWFRQYGVRVLPDLARIIIPTRHGRDSVELQGKPPLAEDDLEDQEDNQVLTISIRGGDMAICKDEQPRDAASDQVIPTAYVEDVVSTVTSLGDGADYDYPIPAEVQQLVDDNGDLFFENTGLGRVSVMQHHIPL